MNELTLRELPQQTTLEDQHTQTHHDNENVPYEETWSARCLARSRKTRMAINDVVRDFNSRFVPRIDDLKTVRRILSLAI
jgi:hypothetical protein